MLSKRFNIKMLAAAVVLVMTLCVSAYAGLKSGSWSLNPADFRYDMSLYFSLADRSLEDLDSYEIGAFVDDECRGVAEKIELTGGESCLYMRIRSNSASGAKIEFRMRQKGSDEYVVLKPENGSDFVFESDTRVGMPSSPFVLARFFNVEVEAGENGSVEFENGLYKEGSQLSLKAVPAEGYHFAQWSDGDSKAERTIKVTGDISLTASFDVNIYKLSFNIDGEVFKEMDVAYGSLIEAPEAPAKEGYTFSCWSDLPETMPAKDIEVTGSYTVNVYKAVFKIDGEVFKTLEVAYGSTIEAPVVEDKEGYIFSGWSEIPETMPANDIEVTGSYTVNVFKAVFKIDGEVFKTLEVAYGSKIEAPEAPAKEGYTFSGWSDLPETMPANDIEVTGSYTLNVYKAVFKIDGEVFKTLEVAYGSAIEAPVAEEKEGYTFSGWSEIPETMPANDIEITGSYTVNIYKVSFNIDGEVFKEINVAYGSLIEAPEAPAREGYTFSGWSELPETMPAKDIEVTGAYTVNIYKAVFKLDGEVFKTLEVAYGSAIEAPEAPAKEGYTFSGWSEIPETMPAKDIEVNGAYTVNIYKAVFKIDGEVFKTLEVAYGSAIEAPEAPAKEGYTFSGWSDLPETMPAKDIEVAGAYTVNIYKAVFKIDGEVFKTLEVAYGSAIEAPEAPAKEGYTFSGWSEIPETMPAKDIEATGAYTVNVYKAVFKIDGEVFKTLEVAYGSAIEAPEAPAKEGYTFSGWSEIPETMPAKDIEVTGAYTVNIYKAVFKIDGEVFKTLEVAYGSKIEAPEAPAKEGYTFSGWSEIPETMPAKDIEVTGAYTVNIYKAVFKIDGEVFKTLDVAFGAKIEAPEAPAKEGYTFSGWSEIPETMPAKDIEVTGAYTVNIYKAVFKIDGEVFKTLDIAFGAKIEAPEAPAKEGYTFSGWSEIPETMPAKDIEVTGAYTVNIYKAVFKIDGEVFKTLEVAFGAKIEAPEAPAKEGYTFSGWSEIPETMPAKDIEVTGAYTVNIYKAVFKIDGEVFKTIEVAFGAKIEAPEAPAKEGYSFSGWTGVPETMPAKDIEVTGAYTVNVYKAVFKIDGEVFKTLEVAFGAKIEAPEAPAKEGYTFSGWSEIPETMPAKDIEVNGAFTVNIYKAVFKIDGEVFKTLEVAYGAKIEIPEAPEREGYSFTGWNDLPETMPASDIESDGSYTLNYYTARFFIDDEVISSLEVAFGAEITVPEAPEKYGYTFGGWIGVPETMPAHDIDIVGSYNIGVYKLTFMVDGEIYKVLDVEYDAIIEAPEAPEKEGYSFVEWLGMPERMIADDLVVSAVYKVNSYLLTVYLDGEVYLEEEVEYGAEIVIPDPEVPADRVFEGWNEEIPETMPAHDVVITGTTKEYNGVAFLPFGEDTPLHVYSLDGVLIVKGIKASEIKERITPGIYIINGKKMVIR